MSYQSAALLKAAVQQPSLIDRQGLRERLFALWFNGLVYNQIWEDPRIDLEALRLDSDSHVLAISSGGCNIFNYLVRVPASITAIDLNQAHINLTRLKLAALKYLPDYEAFFQFFGSANRQANVENYYLYIREHLDDVTRHFWEDDSWLTRQWRGPRIKYFAHNLYDYGRNAYFLRFFHTFAKAIRRDPARLLQARSAEEQRSIFEEIFAPFFDNWFIKLAGRLPITAFGLGIPPQQYRLINTPGTGSVIGLYRERVKRLACEFPINDNYFAWQAFSRSYDQTRRRAIPDYLKAENYDTLKENAHRVRTVVESITGYLREQANQRFNRFILLDAQDWMNPNQITELWHQISRAGSAGSRIIFRTASSESPVEPALPSALRLHFEYERELSSELHKHDRAAIYGGFHVYSLLSKDQARDACILSFG